MALKIKVWQYLLLVAGVQFAAPQIAKLTYRGNVSKIQFEPYQAPYDVRKQEMSEDLSRIENNILIDETHIKKIHNDIYDSINGIKKTK